MERYAEMLDRLEEITGLDAALRDKLLLSLLILAFFYLLASIARRVINDQVEDVAIAHHRRRIVTYLSWGVILLCVARVWFKGVGSIVTVLGIASAGLVIALQDVFANLMGWLFILWRRPFVVGDRIEIAGSAGDVIDIRLFQTHLVEIRNWVHADQSTGRILMVPNARFYREPLANFSRGFDYIWTELAVLITFESNWRKAKQLLADLAQRHCEDLSEDVRERVKDAAKQYPIRFSNVKPRVYTSVKEAGILLTLRYLDRPRRRRDTEEILWEGVLDAFAACDDLDFAYPTVRQFRAPNEAKAGVLRPRSRRAPVDD
jgi:small-conductance mechanosensitive channel